jgi:pimeloyl-ACP methyl ester carboxylesterase
MTTANTARDMDQMRQALGEAKISYYGVSYGTYLGAAYASLFPDKTSRFVLDSTTGPFANWRETFRRFGLAEQSRFPEFAQYVAENNADYGLGATPAEVRATYFALYNQLNQHPIPLPDLGIDLTGEWFRAFTFGGMYSNELFASTARLWRDIQQSQSATALTSLVRDLPSSVAMAFPEIPADNASTSTLAVLCDDAAWSRSVEQYRQELNFDTAQNPVFGPVASNIWACAFWPNQPVESPVVISANGPHNIMIVQNLRDPATPLVGAQEMRTALGQRAQLLTVDQGGHGASYGEANECSKEAVTTYLVTGVLPAQDAHCAAEDTPFVQTEAQASANKELRRRR